MEIDVIMMQAKKKRRCLAISLCLFPADAFVLADNVLDDPKTGPLHAVSEMHPVPNGKKIRRRRISRAAASLLSLLLH